MKAVNMANLCTSHVLSFPARNTTKQMAFAMFALALSLAFFFVDSTSKEPR